MVPYDVFTFLCFLLISLTSTSSKHDFRYISFQDLHQSFNIFSHYETNSYSQMLFDVARNQVLVGARNALYRLSLQNLELLEYASWPASNDKRIQCMNKGQSDEHCHNYIKILLSNGSYIFTCGTNAFSPQCSYRKIQNTSEVIEWVDGIAKCPYNPDSNITGLMTENGQYYFGGPTDFSGSDSVISKTIGTHTIRTKQYNSLWLNQPQFVGSFETEDFIYFLFRETAVEYINCGKAIYSRIARVCKNDSGGHTMLKDNWTTFLKARLNCSLSGEYPFYFNEIQSMSYVANEKIVYATFTTPINSITGSAICAFNLTAIENAFNGPFKYQADIGSAWDKHDVYNKDNFQCKSVLHSNLLETSKYQLMDSAVQSTTLNPLYHANLERFTHITVDVLSTKLYNSFHVVYVSNTDGLIKKISILPKTQEACVVEIWQAVSNVKYSIRNLQFLKQTNSLYVTTDTAILKIPSDHCSRYTSKINCLNSMDPYCGWNERYETCSSAPNSNPLDKYWSQIVHSCPILDAAVNGGWSSWSSWFPCTYRTSFENDSPDTCLCQSRECNNPKPMNGGRECEGLSIAVMNCTVHGGWSDWSAWSACSVTCGTGMKTRSRTCTNPAPAHGGRVCVGQDRTEAFCAEIPPCPASPQDGGWSEWTEWTECSAPCGGGYRKRFRQCNNPVPKNNGQNCTGNDMDIAPCNTHKCTENRNIKITEWFEYNNSNSNQYFRKRFRIICKAPVNGSLIKISIKEESKSCFNNICSSEESEHSKWSSWSSWGECSVTCGGGIQNRSRYCEGQRCFGPLTQTRECNKHQCEEWGCWSDWSPCNVSCGWGVKTRYRKCLGSNCIGRDHEEKPCEDASCDSLLGWGNWTVWSLCDENKLQHRKRECKTENPGPNICQGSNYESRICISTESENYKEQSQGNIGINSASVAASVVMGILIGIFVGALIMHFYMLRKKKNTIPSSPCYISSKQNPYISMPMQERPKKKNIPSSSTNFLNNIQNGTLRKYQDCDTPTIKRNSYGSNNGHVKQDLLNDDKFYYD